uniref:Protein DETOXIFICATION n=1 Tax=Oryza barthii TaxID=65489 RepID=A0A0D3H2U3_9ORYZ
MCHCSSKVVAVAQCHQPLLPPPEACPALHDRPRSARGGGGAIAEVASIVRLAMPMVGAGLLMYMRSLVSMLFLGRLGRLPLAGGSLALGFANITGYSVLSGLAAGMDPVCGQAFGAGRTSVLAAALRRTVVLLLAASVPIAALWLAMHRVLVAAGQDPDIAACAYDARPGRAARINVSAFYGVGMPAALALAFWPARLDFRGMWAGMLAAQLVCAALMLLAVRRTDWDEQAARARELTGAVAGVVVGDGDVVVKGDHADAAKVKADSGLLVVTVLS